MYASFEWVYNVIWNLLWNGRRCLAFVTLVTGKQKIMPCAIEMFEEWRVMDWQCQSVFHQITLHYVLPPKSVWFFFLFCLHICCWDINDFLIANNWELLNAIIGSLLNITIYFIWLGIPRRWWQQQQQQQPEKIKRRKQHREDSILDRDCMGYVVHVM